MATKALDVSVAEGALQGFHLPTYRISDSPSSRQLYRSTLRYVVLLLLSAAAVDWKLYDSFPSVGNVSFYPLTSEILGPYPNPEVLLLEVLHNVPTMDPDFPSAPRIDGEAMLTIFVHQSIKMYSEYLYADGSRLATLGNAILEASYMAILFNKQPMLTAEELEVSCCSHTLFVPSTIAVRHRPVVASFRIWSRSGSSNTSGEKKCAMLRV